MLKLPLSDASKMMISQSRKIALGLGYDYISSIHFMMAEMEGDGIVKSLLSERIGDFNAFYETGRIGNAIKKGDVPLTVEAELALKKSTIEAFIHSSKVVEPYHILLAALKNPKSSVSEFMNSQKLSYHDIQTYILNNWYIKGHGFKYKWNKIFYLPFVRKLIIGKLVVKYDKPYWS